MTDYIHRLINGNRPTRHTRVPVNFYVAAEKRFLSKNVYIPLTTDFFPPYGDQPSKRRGSDSTAHPSFGKAEYVNNSDLYAYKMARVDRSRPTVCRRGGGGALTAKTGPSPPPGTADSSTIDWLATVECNSLHFSMHIFFATGHKNCCRFAWLVSDRLASSTLPVRVIFHLYHFYLSTFESEMQSFSAEGEFAAMPQYVISKARVGPVVFHFHFRFAGLSSHSHNTSTQRLLIKDTFEKTCVSSFSNNPIEF